MKVYHLKNEVSKAQFNTYKSICKWQKFARRFTSQRETPWELKGYKAISLNPFTPKSNLIDFTLSNARRFYSSKGDPLGVKGLNPTTETNLDQLCIQACASPARSP